MVELLKSLQGADFESAQGIVKTLDRMLVLMNQRLVNADKRKNISIWLSIINYYTILILTLNKSNKEYWIISFSKSKFTDFGGNKRLKPLSNAIGSRSGPSLSDCINFSSKDILSAHF